MRRNVASQVIAAQLVSATDGSDVTSGTTTVYGTGDGGAQGSWGTATSEGNGCWTFLPSAGNTDYDHVVFTFVNTSAISVSVQVYPVSFNPTDGVRMGLTALPNAVPAGAGGLPTVDASNMIVGIQGTKNDLDDLNDITTAQVNTEVVDALNVDTITLPTQGALPLTPTHRQAISWLYKVLRNKLTNDGTTIKMFDDAGAVVDTKWGISEAGGTVTRDEAITGP